MVFISDESPRSMQLSELLLDAVMLYMVEKSGQLCEIQQMLTECLACKEGADPAVGAFGKAP